MAILTSSGRTAIAIAVYGRPLHLAWGTGNAGWDDTPVAEPIGATALVAELGRKAVSSRKYVSPNPSGDIVVPAGTFAESVTPTNALYLRTNFDYADASDGVIREVGLFMDTVIESGLPEGQTYFEPEDVADPGVLMTLQRIHRIDRSPSVQQAFEFVLIF